MTGRKFGVGELGADVISYISHATQTRLQNLLEKVSHVAQLKNQSPKVMVAGGNSSQSPVILTSLLSVPPGGRAARAGQRRPHSAQILRAAGSAGEAEEGGAGERDPAEGCQGNEATEDEASAPRSAVPACLEGGDLLSKAANEWNIPAVEY